MSIRVGLGMPTHMFSSANSYFRWIEYCENHGVDSLWQSDRLISSEMHLESLSVMAIIAGATERLKFGMNAVVLPCRDPLVLAKQCATIDYLSNGRLLPVFGVGAASNPIWKSTGRIAKERGRRADEIISIVTRLWDGERVTFEGEFYQYENVCIAPRPVQTPLPLWIGGNSEAAIRRTASLGTGWLGSIVTPDKTRDIVTKIKAQLKETGRQIEDDHYGLTVRFRFGSSEDGPVGKFIDQIAARRPDAFDPETCLAVGGAKEIISTLRRYVQAGVSKFVAIPMVESEEDVFYQTKALVNEVLPVIEDR